MVIRYRYNIALPQMCLNSQFIFTLRDDVLKVSFEDAKVSLKAGFPHRHAPFIKQLTYEFYKYKFLPESELSTLEEVVVYRPPSRHHWVKCKITLRKKT